MSSLPDRSGEWRDADADRILAHVCRHWPRRDSWDMAKALGVPEATVANALARWRDECHAIKARRAASRAATEAKIAWCPPEHRGLYRRLTRGVKLPAAAARAEVEAYMRKRERAGQAPESAGRLP